MASTIETHPQYPQILQWIADGLDASRIAPRLQPPVHRTTIWRFIRNKVQPAMQGPAAVVSDLAAKGLLRQDVAPHQAMQAVRAATSAALATDPILARMAERRSERERVMGKAEDSGDLRAWCAADRNDISATELEARLTGRLDAAPAGTSSTFVLVPIAVPGPPAALPQPAQDVEWSEVKPEDSNT